MAKKPKSFRQKITLRLVRLSFAQNLFEPGRFDEADTSKDPTYSSRFILRTDDPAQNAQIINIRKVIKELSMQAFGEELEESRLCFRDGSKGKAKEWAGYGPGTFFIAASAPANARPWVGKNVGGNLIEITKDDKHAPYSGCYVNATVELYTQDHPKWGQRVNGSLRGVSFGKDGEPFGRAPVKDGNEEFADLQGALGEDTAADIAGGDGADLL